MTIEENNGPAAPYQGPSANSATQGHGSKQEQDAVQSEAELGVDSVPSDSDQDGLDEGGHGAAKTD